jgi:hypothetical protein
MLLVGSVLTLDLERREAAARPMKWVSAIE